MNQSRAGGNSGLRILAAGVVLLLAGLTSSALLGFQARPRVEEEEDEKPAAKRKIDEQEDTRPTPKRKTIRPDDDEDDRPATPRPSTGTFDLARAAREAKNPQVKALFTSLLRPADQVTLREIKGVTISGNRPLKGTLRVKPLPVYAASAADLKDTLELHILDKDDKKVRTEKVGPNLVIALRYFEQIALDDVQALLDSPLERLPSDDPRRLSKYDKLLTAEQALGAVLRFHQSARERGIRKGGGWDAVEEAIRGKLLGVQLEQLDTMIEAKSWDAAFEFTRRLTETFRRPGEQKRILGPLAKLLAQAIQDPNYAQERMRDARQRLRQFEEEFPNSPTLKPIHDKLRDQAQELYNQARSLVKEDKKGEALLRLRQAEQIWPELPGLRAYRMQIDSAYQVLKVGMRELPTYLSPAWAVTDAELRAVDLLFESLVTLAPDSDGVLYYRPGLAEGRIQVVPLGREFRLPRAARWSDDDELTAGDVSFTVDQLKKGKGTGWSSAWGDLLNKVRVEGDPYRVRLVMRQGFIDPLALMSFKVLPARPRLDPDSEKFALEPIGSGPFVHAGAGGDKGRSSVLFRASPHYGVRAGKLGRPLIREVHFVRSSDPVKDLGDGSIDLALDLTGEQAAALRKDDRYDVPLPGEKSVNRRIYFLAVNHRKAPLDRAEFRIALAQAIDREGLLDSHFRKGLGRVVHRALNGPYPARSWACKPGLVSRTDKTSLDPYDRAAAAAGVRQVMAKRAVKQFRLSLKYPAGDSVMEAAILDLCERVNKLLPEVKLVPERRSPKDLREDVEQTHSYELAYYWYDFPDETFWLMPLLGPGGRGGGENFLGYNGVLVNRVQTVTNRRCFAQVRRDAHDIHQLFLQGEMPFIPLWQLDPLSASKKGEVEMVPFDPHRIFARIDQWKVKHRR